MFTTWRPLARFLLLSLLGAPNRPTLESQDKYSSCCIGFFGSLILVIVTTNTRVYLVARGYHYMHFSYHVYKFYRTNCNKPRLVDIFIVNRYAACSFPILVLAVVPYMHSSGATTQLFDNFTR